MLQKGNVVFITGGGRGIGRAAAMALARAGARVAICSRTLSDVEKVAAEIRQAGGEALPVQCDVAEPSQVEATVAQIVAQFGAIDILG